MSVDHVLECYWRHLADKNIGEVKEAKILEHISLGWPRNPFAQFLHRWPLVRQIVLSHGFSASSHTMWGHPSESKAKVVGVYLLKFPVVHPTISSPVIPGSQLQRTAGPAYPGSDGLQAAALCKMLGGKELSSGEACLELGWYRPSSCSWLPAFSWHIPSKTLLSSQLSKPIGHAQLNEQNRWGKHC